MTSLPEDQQRNYEIFRDCLSAALIEKISRPEPKPKRRSKSKKATSSSSSSSPASTQDIADADLNNADDLADFADYIATETFRALPEQLKTIDYHEYTNDANLQARFAHHRLPNPHMYSITSESAPRPRRIPRPHPNDDVPIFARDGAPRATLPDADDDGCELCGRDLGPALSYHHFDPAVRARRQGGVKRGWHRAATDLESVAWRGCAGTCPSVCASVCGA
ncbi:uncharacterized protein F4817DRAFT_196243 [Daldinia loculata]|uniref:uncharacterized protein n=1 Tax=Daldinia loculata TaxID=103429 RepID=UPI0020C23AD2|nr:uncharacterized protein F4817DRAFT_196243 [Daldinia loculata]KAI1644962.1 hypothetical protein F4817DRAFT_196243 [Daldinia loculata]